MALIERQSISTLEIARRLAAQFTGLLSEPVEFRGEFSSSLSDALAIVGRAAWPRLVQCSLAWYRPRRNSESLARSNARDPPRIGDHPAGRVLEVVRQH
jgi:hypothetical protein